MARITGVHVKSEDGQVKLVAEFDPGDDVDSITEQYAFRADKLTRKIRTAKRMAGKKGTDANSTPNS